ncbi:MAG TPA: STAS domain-containing protein [Micromonosporaceae bacterium]
MEVNKKRMGPVTVARLTGVMDSASTSQIHEQIVPMLLNRRPLLMDMTGVSHVSDAGLRTLLTVYRQAQAVDGNVALVGLSDEVRTVLAATGFLRFFVVANDVPTGLTALRSARPAEGSVGA